MRLCFLVKVRKASGRNVAGGSRIGKMVALAGGGGAKGLRVCAGVPKAGEEEGIMSEAEAAAAGRAGVLGANIDAGPALDFCIVPRLERAEGSRSDRLFLVDVRGGRRDLVAKCSLAESWLLIGMLVTFATGEKRCDGVCSRGC